VATFAVELQEARPSSHIIPRLICVINLTFLGLRNPVQWTQSFLWT